jgi:hypothetical protein
MAQTEIYGSKTEKYIQLRKALSIIAGLNHKFKNNEKKNVILITYFYGNFNKGQRHAALEGKDGWIMENYFLSDSISCCSYTLKKGR